MKSSFLGGNMYEFWVSYFSVLQSTCIVDFLTMSPGQWNVNDEESTEGK